MLSGPSPLARLADEGVLAVPTQQRSADAVWAEIPAYAKAVVFDRHAHVVGWLPVEESDPEVASVAHRGCVRRPRAGERGR